MKTEQEIAALKNAVYAAQAVANSAIVSALGAVGISASQAKAASDAVMWADLIEKCPAEPVNKVYARVQTAAKIGPAKIADVRAASNAAVKNFIKAVNNYNAALAENDVEQKIADRIQASAEKYKLTPEEVTTNLQLDFLRANYLQIYRNVIKEAKRLANAKGEAVQAEVATLDGFSDILDDVLDALNPVNQIKAAFKAVSKGFNKIVESVRGTPAWAIVLFSPVVISKSLMEGAGAAAMSLYDSNKKLLKIMVRYSPTVLLMREIVPENVYNETRQFEQHYRDEIKIAGAIAAVAVGAYAVAPEMVAGLAANVGATVGESVAWVKATAATAAADLTKNLTVDAAKAQAKEAIIEKVKAEIPDAAKVGEMIGAKMQDYVQKIGKEKVDEILKANSGGGPIKSASDPRLAKIQAELVKAANGGAGPGVDVLTAAAKNGNSSAAPSALPYVVPAVALATFFFK